jgi:hypothetical protein
LKDLTLTPPNSLGMKDLVELRESADPTRGRVVATRDNGTWIYVLWQQRPGHEGKVAWSRLRIFGSSA